MAISITEKLAVTGAFLALVAMVVGTEDDPGLVADGQLVSGTLQVRGAAAQAAGRPEPGRNSGAGNHWSLPANGSGVPQGPPMIRPKAPEEHLPPGFGATPSPDELT